MAEPTDLTEQELLQVDACVEAVRQKEQGSVNSPALLIADTVDRLVQEVRRRRAEQQSLDELREMVKSDTMFK